MILLTRKGERIMDDNFGVGLQNYLFEFPTNQVLSAIKNESIQQINTHAPYITINDFIVNYDGASIIIRIDYTIKENQSSATYELSIANMS